MRAVLEAVATCWAIGAVVVLTAAVIATPPRDVVGFGHRLKGALAWPWYLGLVLAVLLVAAFADRDLDLEIEE